MGIKWKLLTTNNLLRTNLQQLFCILDKRVDIENTYKWRGLNWIRWEWGEGREIRCSGDIKCGSPLRVDIRRAGVSIGAGQLPSWSTPVLAPPLLLHVLTTKFMIGLLLFVCFGWEPKSEARHVAKKNRDVGF